jgi:pimeloyl-ACP methyl ester carboxylesterase
MTTPQTRTATTAGMATGSVVSRDGTRIGYLRVGRGPAVVLLHGSNESARSHTQLALALADTFTVYLPDRRGRGMSAPTAPTTASAPRSRTCRPSSPNPARRRSSGSASVG